MNYVSLSLEGAIEVSTYKLKDHKIKMFLGLKTIFSVLS